MSKLLITILMTVIIGGVCLFIMGKQVGPATINAGEVQRNHIQAAFQ